jgi:hypothetical protein
MGLVDFSVGDIGEVFKDVREAITGEAIKDPQKEAELLYKLKLLENEQMKAQTKINEVEAASKSLFVSGWRPSIGWVGSFALAYTFVLAPFMHSVLFIYGVNYPLPELDTGLLMNLVMSMLGVAGLRKYEKAKGIQNNISE